MTDKLSYLGNNNDKIVLSFFLWGILCIIINFCFLSYVGTNQHTVIVKIRQGSSTAEIANLLERKGIISNVFFFKVLAKTNQLDQNLKAGSYAFPPRPTIKQVIQQLAEGKSLTVTVTIPEGYTVEQIASLLAEKKLVNKLKFLHLAKKNKFSFSFLAEAQSRKQTVEGYLFPDTYQLEADDSEVEIINIMLKRFKEKMDFLLIKNKEQENFSLHNLVTLASIIEKEAKINRERTLISAVFQNRLDKQMKLQSCATVQYILKKHKTQLSYDDIKIASPYNTYLHEGLPPGPIGNAGLASLQAALHPASVEYLYFVAKGDGSHYFSKNYQEHLAAIARSEEER